MSALHEPFRHCGSARLTQNNIAVMPHFTEPLREASDVRRLGNVGGDEHEVGDAAKR